MHDKSFRPAKYPHQVLYVSFEPHLNDNIWSEYCSDYPTNNIFRMFFILFVSLPWCCSSLTLSPMIKCNLQVLTFLGRWQHFSDSNAPACLRRNFTLCVLGTKMSLTPLHDVILTKCLVESSSEVTTVLKHDSSVITQWSQQGVTSTDVPFLNVGGVDVEVCLVHGVRLIGLDLQEGQDLVSWQRETSV